MAKKITIQHLYTTTGTTAPTGLIEGEIAISHATGSEAIFLKNDKNDNEVKFIPKTQIESLISAATSGLATDVNISALTTDLTSHKNLKGSENKGSTLTFGHVTLVSGDISGITGHNDGLAASGYHTHGQYLTGVTGDSGQSIVSIIKDGVATIGLTTGITNQISSGATAYGWGNHANAGYAKNNDLTAHTNSGDIHVTKEQKNAWDTASSAITAFLDNNAAISGAVDTLREINEYLTGTGTSVETLLETLDDLTNTVSGNTDDITSLKGSVTGLQTDVQSKVETIDVVGNLSAVVTSTINEPKKYTITHTAASDQTSAITATNTATGFSFGSNFSFVNRIGYDKNGHVVSGSTQTLTLPDLPTADADTAGIVKIQYGALGIEEELLPQSTGVAADISHYHTQYVKFTDLGSNTDGTITISCGTY